MTASGHTDDAVTHASIGPICHRKRAPHRQYPQKNERSSGPPQSTLPIYTSSSTVTNFTVCGDGSFHSAVRIAETQKDNSNGSSVLLHVRQYRGSRTESGVKNESSFL
jgi:hypothetical protein